MAQMRRDSIRSSELYFSVHGKKLEPQKIKSYALYKPLFENIAVNNFVVHVNEPNEIFISFKEGLESKFFTFDKVFQNRIAQDELYLLTKSAIQDVIMGLNSFLILCKFAYPISSEIWLEMDLFKNMATNVLKELLFFVNKEENRDYSLYVSYFEMHDNKIIDLLSECGESGDIQMYENLRKKCVEIKGLVEKPVIDDKDIVELFSRQPYKSLCIGTCCHLIIFVSLVRRNINDGLEFIKTGKLTLVSPARCNNSYLENSNTDDCLLKLADHKFLTSSEHEMLNFLKQAFGGNATTTVIVFVSSILCLLEKDLKLLQFLSEIGNLKTHPEIDLQLIIRNSIKEYAEEVKELQKYLYSTSNGIGIRVDHLMYRSLKNSLALENEEVNHLECYVLSLTDSINFKKQQIICLQAAFESKEIEIKDVENSSEKLKLKLKELLNENNIQTVYLKAADIIAVKQKVISNELHLKKLRLELIKANRNYNELTRSIHFLKNETVTLLCDIDAQNTSQKSTLELLIVDMNNTFAQFQSLEKDLTTKLSALNMRWKDYAESFVSKFSSFVQEGNEHFTSIKLEMSAVWTPLHISKTETVDKIKNKWSEKVAVMNDYFSKLKVLCESSFKMIAEINHHMAVIESCYKAEFKAIAEAFSLTNEAFKNFFTDICLALKFFQQYFEEQEKELLNLADTICFHQKFKKQLDGKIDDIKQSVHALKQMYLEYHDAANSKWNEIQKSCLNTTQKHKDLSDHLPLFQRDMSKYLNNLSQQKLNALEYFPLKRNTRNVENQILQVLQIYKEIKGNLEEASKAHKKGIDEESLEVEKHMTLRKTEIEKYFNTVSVKLKASINNFLDEWRNRHIFSSNAIKDEFEKDLDSLSSLSHFELIFHNYLSTSNSILAKSERSFKVIPSVSEDKNDSTLDFENLLLDEWRVDTSTPNVPEKKEFNISKEKEKFICRIKSLAEQQISQKPNTSVLDYEKKGAANVSTMSLPNLRIYAKPSIMTEKRFSQLKSSKK